MKKFEYNLVDVTQPLDGRVVYTNSWWYCSDSDPRKALFYNRTAPQANKLKSVLLHGFKAEKFGDLNVGIIFIPVAYVPPRN